MSVPIRYRCFTQKAATRIVDWRGFFAALRMVTAATIDISDSDIIVCPSAAGVVNWTTISF